MGSGARDGMRDAFRNSKRGCSCRQMLVWPKHSCVSCSLKLLARNEFRLLNARTNRPLLLGAGHMSHAYDHETYT
jgi:hypothetical protein